MSWNPRYHKICTMVGEKSRVGGCLIILFIFLILNYNSNTADKFLWLYCSNINRIPFIVSSIMLSACISLVSFNLQITVCTLYNQVICAWQPCFVTPVESCARQIALESSGTSGVQTLSMTRYFTNTWYKKMKIIWIHNNLIAILKVIWFIWPSLSSLLLSWLRRLDSSIKYWVYP